jgi:predicted RNase H-like HicB family nuclease
LWKQHELSCDARKCVFEASEGNSLIACAAFRWHPHGDMKLNAVFEPAAEGGYVCWLEEMPGVQSQGDTLDEARSNLQDALKLSLEYLRERARQESSPQSLRESIEVSVQ